MSELACTWDINAFSAQAVYTGENRLVRVQGEGVCPKGGFSVTLVHVNPGIVPVPHQLMLGLVETAPDIGPDSLTPTPVDEVFEVSQVVTEVGIRGLGVITVKEPA